MTRSGTPRNAAQVKKAAQSRRAGRIADAASVGVKVLLTKILLLGIVDAISVYALFVLALTQDWLVFTAVLLVALLVNVIYFRRGGLPAKYLTPGLIFLAVFQIFVIGYTGYIAFTNYGTGHNSTKDDAISSLIVSSQQRVPDSPSYALTILERLGTYSFLVTDPAGRVSVGDEITPLSRVTDAETDASGQAIALPGFTSLGFSDIVANQERIAALSVPLSNDPNDGTLRTPDGSSAYLYLSDLVYDEAADTLSDTTQNVVYTANGTTGSFVADDGTELLPGWKVEVGFDNFTKAFTTDSIRGPLISVTVWTFVFAFLSVGTAFALGLFLAIVFNDLRMRGRNVYRVILILPYAFPGFLSALVWAGMLNPQFGFVNQVLFGGAEIPWLTNEWLAKFSIILVNLWLTFPYMFLVTTGALQSIPEELQEAATVDGAKPWAIFRLIKLPLLLVSVAPLLIASFAFAFNNFNLVYMLTNGGPRDVTAGVNVGATDILITMVYKVAFDGANRDYGLASAFSIVIFVLVAAVSIISFRQTKALEELN
ncbi:ABC transporter permease subunit [Cryobacterium sp. CG_9.6]|uniref:ABC transporter permease subunit n=1 Tax=Cryobacterium sp. CG_9.6 TaxID=2760710 RepID=UPI0024753AD2|nr:ABC transporter permease subunit [Cryobacterium sp. CG_9.6]MDH6235657.1 arabinogalactan oligomer/maltooligosaccharide transport system permease protein [Cryobacterium sp. CG_9.6]